jgi:lactate 2-monooxygenase
MKKLFNAVTRQREVYITGLSGKQPPVPVDPDLLEKAAQKVMSPKGFAYVAGGAGKELTVKANRTDFSKWSIKPRMLRDVSERDISIELFGKTYPTPFLAAPIGVLEMAHPKAEYAVGAAASRFDIPMIFSSQASVPMEDVSAKMGNSPRWFQLYWSKSNELVESLVSRAEQCGCEAIVVTLDTTLLGWRIRDLDLAFLPFLQGMGIAQYTSDPVFQRLMEEQSEDDERLKPPVTFQTIRSLINLVRNHPGSFWSNLRNGAPMKAVRLFINIYSRPSLTWDDLAFLRECTKLPILLKGIHHPDDARKAADMGIDGLIVSNHGGRQVDGAVSSIEMLPQITKAVGDQMTVLFDSGIRTGADVFKALALGAKGVCIGRPFVYGLALKGQRGVEEVFKNFIADFDLTMGLSGCRSVEEITEDCLEEAI